jgi:hypothetical protein
VALGLIAIALFLHGFAYLVLYQSADLSRPPDKRMLVMLTGTLALYGSMMLSQAMEAVTRAFYGRGDLDLILSSPVAAWRLFAVRARRRDPPGIAHRSSHASTAVAGICASRPLVGYAPAVFISTKKDARGGNGLPRRHRPFA